MARTSKAELNSTLESLGRAQTQSTRALGRLAQAVEDLVQAQREQTRQQTATNFIVRSQIETDPDEKRRLIARATQLMESPRRAARNAHVSPTQNP